MSETPSSKPRHALSDTGVSVPVQGGPRDDPFGEAPTQALPVIPRPRDDRDGAGHPAVATLARLPEPFRPAPVHAVPAAAPAGSGRFRLPELPWAARPVLAAATALVLALGVVAGVSGAPDPAAAPPEAPVSGP
ncbi:hypothetical protein ACLFMI_06935 [Pseudonocardia nantongensis]|uniref:hypothetical protein n=1 Tax=Pseudonocardia nantongensis TaxID=1181885 RepID=UPI0039781950